ncbi:uncharacterized protein TRIADDRAFT_53288 [Trichoplax adhaerens]|uniref:Uncharacterized protein n=1 Tax=Trichoplax adhaerens TaxID=10228 RepID=B3RNU3_TRIAD|nr:hypothetical protein TRIADDRAFT_53288 [Trichoplax adhaerens]EDV28071.1 hypothetical protein TRIADDRAFT_53288 [Trichoplax adhaerens]|eukprot:XP_002109905.1 hypothetical protein TRIADDRAFT_53288 [Trichoplax adhaerens]
MNLVEIGLIVAVAIPAHILGALWYGILFGQAWYTRVYKIPNRKMENDNSVLPYLISFTSNVVASYLLYVWFGTQTTYGFVPTLAIASVVIMALAAPQFAFSQWSPIVYLIDCSHSIACVAAMAYIHRYLIHQQ